MAAHSSILAWQIQWTEEPDELQSMGLQRVGHTQRLSTHIPDEQSCKNPQQNISKPTLAIH